MGFCVSDTFETKKPMEHICVVMPSFLGEYKGCAANREQKFIRAINSFMTQDYVEKSLVIVSDGCPITSRIYNESKDTLLSLNIHLVTLLKQPFLSGSVRMNGIRFASDCLGADYITYLDTDDVILPNHLSSIVKGFHCADDLSWIWYDDRLSTGEVRQASLMESHIGTSNIAHRSSAPIIWGDGYGHDWKAINSIQQLKNIKIDISSYVVCHIPNQLDQ